MMNAELLTLSVFAALQLHCCTSSGKCDTYYSEVVDSTEIIVDSNRVSSRNMPDTLTISLSGDIMMGTTYPNTALPPNDGRDLFADVKPFLQDADLAVGNLEGTLSSGLQCAKRKSAHTFAFSTPPSYAANLKDAGYDFLSMANNHAMDFGVAGVKSSETALDSEGIKYAGIKGRTSMAVVERNGVRFGLCAFGHNGYTYRTQEFDGVKTILDSLKQCSDIVIVSFHGGAEGSDKGRLPYGKEIFLGEDRGSLREFARFCIDNGADIVYGHGPHVVRCVEVYKNRFIAYSLGNFCTPYGMNLTGTLGYAPVITVKVGPDGGFISGKIHPFIQRRGVGPRHDTAGIVINHIKNLTQQDIKDSKVSILPSGEIKLNNK